MQEGSFVAAAILYEQVQSLYDGACELDETEYATESHVSRSFNDSEQCIIRTFLLEDFYDCRINLYMIMFALVAWSHGNASTADLYSNPFRVPFEIFDYKSMCEPFFLDVVSLARSDNEGLERMRLKRAALFWLVASARSMKNRRIHDLFPIRWTETSLPPEALSTELWVKVFESVHDELFNAFQKDFCICCLNGDCKT